MMHHWIFRDLMEWGTTARYSKGLAAAFSSANLKDSLQKMTNSELVNVDNPIDTKRLKD